MKKFLKFFLRLNIERSNDKLTLRSLKNLHPSAARHPEARGDV